MHLAHALVAIAWSACRPVPDGTDATTPDVTTDRGFADRGAVISDVSSGIGRRRLIGHYVLRRDIGRDRIHARVERGITG